MAAAGGTLTLPTFNGYSGSLNYGALTGATTVPMPVALSFANYLYAGGQTGMPIASPAPATIYAVVNVQNTSATAAVSFGTAQSMSITIPTLVGVSTAVVRYWEWMTGSPASAMCVTTSGGTALTVTPGQRRHHDSVAAYPRYRGVHVAAGRRRGGYRAVLPDGQRDHRGHQHLGTNKDSETKQESAVCVMQRFFVMIQHAFDDARGGWAVHLKCSQPLSCLSREVYAMHPARTLRFVAAALVVSGGLIVASCGGGSVNTTPVASTSAPVTQSIPAAGGTLTLASSQSQVSTLTFSAGAPAGVALTASGSATAPAGTPAVTSLKRGAESGVTGGVPFFYVTFSVSANLSAQFLASETVSLAPARRRRGSPTSRSGGSLFLILAGHAEDRTLSVVRRVVQ